MTEPDELDQILRDVVDARSKLAQRGFSVSAMIVPMEWKAIFFALPPRLAAWMNVLGDGRLRLLEADVIFADVAAPIAGTYDCKFPAASPLPPD